jgi:two-component system chemotaxis sensor kinase CheA
MLSLGLAPPAKSDTAYDPFECRLVLLAVSAAPVGEVRRALRLVLDQVELAPLPQANAGDLPSDAPTAGGTDDASVAAYRTMRVDAGSIEALAAMVDELVVARTTLGSLAKRAADGAEPREVAETLAKVHGTLDRLIGRTHQQVTRVRMTQVAPLLRRFPRVVRTMARALDKDIDVVIVDNGVEADKTVIDGLFEPLTHLLRNAVDHGVEAAAARISQGKPRKATIRLTAMAVDGRLILTIEDDGGGIDPGAIRAAVIAKGLRTQAQVAALDDAEIVDLIFLPGFSTATSVTDLSGRGVGMDAVRKAVQRLGGRLSISTRHQSGTTVRLAIPLSLTLTKVIVVESGGEAYGLPMDRVLETMRLPAAAIFAIRAGHAFNWRGRAVPILPLAGLVSRGAVLAGAAHKIVVLQSGSGIVGLAVDAIQDRADVTVRPLDGLLAGLPGVTGSTLMGDGSVLMILDPEALVG